MARCVFNLGELSTYHGCTGTVCTIGFDYAEFPGPTYYNWVGAYLGVEAGLAPGDCGGAGVPLLVSRVEFDALKELTVVNQTLKDELALVRTNADANRLAVVEKVDGSEGIVVVGVVLLALILGLFFGWKALGRGAGRSG